MLQGAAAVMRLAQVRHNCQPLWPLLRAWRRRCCEVVLWAHHLLWITTPAGSVRPVRCLFLGTISRNTCSINQANLHCPALFQLSREIVLAELQSEHSRLCSIGYGCFGMVVY